MFSQSVVLAQGFLHAKRKHTPFIMRCWLENRKTKGDSSKTTVHRVKEEDALMLLLIKWREKCYLEREVPFTSSLCLYIFTDFYLFGSTES